MNKLVIPKRFYYTLLTSALAICLISFTIGRELFADKTESIFSFGLIHFSGYLFFLLMPVELAFVYYLSYCSHLELILLALSTAIFAQCIDYYIGKLIRPKRIFELLGPKRMIKAERQINKFGLLIIFVFNLFPLSSPIIALAAGMVKFRFGRFLMASGAGLLLKYGIMTLIFA